MTPDDPLPPPPDESPLVWGEDGAPRSWRFDDVYFSRVDGLAESRAVYLAGCGLPETWRGRNRFVVGELGFGTGLNILALLDLWRRTRDPDARLHIFSIEAFPLSRDEAARALSAWPELAELAAMLLARWPRRARGFHRVSFEALGATLDLAIMDAAEALDAWSGPADAWFLDGFTPARNPGMWSEPVLKSLADRSAPGARAATFTVAGAVRRGLEANGFAVERRPGFGQKRQRLEAWLPAPAKPISLTLPSVAIIGAGIAGASLARAFSALGIRPLVVEAGGPGAGASGNPAALVMPRLDAGGETIAQLYAQAFARAVDLYAETPDAVISRGAVQLEAGPKDPSRFDRIAASDLFEAGAVLRLDDSAASARLGEGTGGGLAFTEAMVVEPAVLLGHWISDAEERGARVATLERDGDGWRLLDAAGGVIARADIVCLATGVATAALAPDAPLSPVRGQVSVIDSAPATPIRAGIWSGYVIPTRTGLLFGATHDRGETSDAVLEVDHARNLELLRQGRPDLAASVDTTALSGRASIRAVTPDFLPLAGAVEGVTGLFVLSGLGSRGYCAAPLLAEHVAALATGSPSPLPGPLAAIVDPARFTLRRNRRLGRLGIRSTLDGRDPDAGPPLSEETP